MNVQCRLLDSHACAPSMRNGAPIETRRSAHRLRHELPAPAIHNELLWRENETTVDSQWDHPTRTRPRRQTKQSLLHKLCVCATALTDKAAV